MPHCPQFWLSALRFTQLLPHGASPGLQLMPQVPPAHLAEPLLGIGQAFAQSPQFLGSSVRLAQAPEQFFWLAGQLAAHWPAEQTCPASQACPQEPQLAGSCFVSMQVAPHLTNEPSQVTAQAPEAQRALPFSGASQVCPQPPQFNASVAGSTQLEPQGAKPSSQVNPHAEPVQEGKPWAGMGQAMPQSPQ